MKKSKPNLLMIIGWILFAVVRIVLYSATEFYGYHALNGFAIGLILAGSVLQVLDYHGMSDKLKLWKLRLFGKGQEM